MIEVLKYSINFICLIIGYATLFIIVAKYLMDFYLFIIKKTINNLFFHLKITTAIIEYFYLRKDFKEWKKQIKNNPKTNDYDTNN